MSHWQSIREHAAGIASGFSPDSADIIPAGDLVRRAAERFGLTLSPEHPASANLRGALAVLEDDVIFFDNSLPEWHLHYCIAHEIGHHVLHQSGVQCRAGDIDGFDAEGSDAATERVSGYGPGERREREANVFAIELLLPAPTLRAMFSGNGANASSIAARVGLPVDLVYTQLARAVLLPVAEPTSSEETSAEPDESQRAAAEAPHGPLLIAAGPGTGKTQTLIRRILFLLDRGIRPERILALTFSNKAAEEMRERVARVRPEEAKKIPVMTFHGFGFDLLRRYWKEAGLDPDSRLIDRVDAVLYLERHLAGLPLRHFESLHEPSRNLGAILGAISRAKDELASPETYRRLGEEMLAAAGEDEKSLIRAEKVLETAAVYEFYESLLEREKLLDFGDLIKKAVELLRSNGAVANGVRGSYDAILVDEFQDVNRACGLLLTEIAGDGRGLWAVGDLRQSIYRWRGASPANIRLFEDDFPDGQTLPLKGNYRSAEPIVSVFRSFARQMKAADEGDFCDWEARRESIEGRVTYEIAPNAASEAQTIARNILKNRADGIPFREQAIICRTYRQLNRFVAALAENQIPVLYLGELFERDEIRDLLALLELRISRSGFALQRVGEFAEYSVSRDEIARILREASSIDEGFQSLFQDADRAGESIAAESEGFAALLRHLRAISPQETPWCAIAAYLFDHSRYLRDALAGDSVQTTEKRLAVYQLLTFAKAQESRPKPSSGNEIASMLSHVRQLLRLGEDRSFAQVPEAAAALDAVRLMTVHAAKGLEFDAVFLPHLGKSYFPASNRAETCPTPDGLTALPGDFRAEEEECLFFVALSRARKRLFLSRAETYGKIKRGASEFIEMLGDELPEPVIAQSVAVPEIEVILHEFTRNEFSIRQLDDYQKCPRLFFYRYVLRMWDRDQPGVYPRFHGVVTRTLTELQSRQQSGENLIESARTLLETNWTEAGIDDHSYAPLYRAAAEQMIARFCASVEAASGEFFRQQISAELGNGRVFVRPGQFEIRGDAVTVRRFLTRRAPAAKDGRTDVTDDDVLTIIAASAHFEGRDVALENVYLQDGIVRPVDASPRVQKNRREKMESIVAAILKGEFGATPDQQICPGCAYFFICPK